MWYYLNHSISDPELYIEGYNFVQADRTVASGKQGVGGIFIYHSDKYNASPIPDSSTCSPHLATAWVKIKSKNAHDVVICSLYRLPDGNLNEATRITAIISNRPQLVQYPELLAHSN